MNKIIWIALIGMVTVSCGQSGKQKNDDSEQPEMDRRTEIRLKQYKVEGMKLYQTYCANCHQANGEGMANLYPPLKNADYLLEDLPRAACIIQNGQQAEIMVNGKKYNQMMPGFSQLTPLEVAEILTYITNAWGNEKGISGVKDVTRWLEDCENE